MLVFDGENPAGYPKKIYTFEPENHRKTSVKHFLEKPIEFFFVSFSKPFVQD